MITFGVNYLETNAKVVSTPLWMKSERYDFCEQASCMRKETLNKKKKFSQLNRLLSMFL